MDQVGKTPLHFFSYLILLYCLGIVKESNNYTLGKGVALDLWLEELTAFIGINIAMKMIKLLQKLRINGQLRIC